MNNRFGLTTLTVALILSGCGDGDVETPLVPSAEYTAFQSPELVEIQGYSGEVMEPFITRDGRFLFFNNMGDDKDIFFAIRDGITGNFTYVDAIAAVNTPAVEGVPTLDDNNRFYYISTFNYPPANARILDTIYVGDFDSSSPAVVNNLAVVANLDEGILGHLNFDVEVSPEGATLYFVDGVFSGNPYPDVSNFVYAVDSGNGFVRQGDSPDIFSNINTGDLEYAACISRDGLEFFFTRLVLSTLETTIHRSTRPEISAPFGIPQKVSSISGFVEAPALSADEKSLYYHRRNPDSGKFELFRVTRP